MQKKQNWESTPLSPSTRRDLLSEQLSLNPREWAAALDFLQSNDLSSLEPGRHQITEKAYANVQEYVTRSESKYEAHKEYIDIQIVTSGSEYIYVAPIGKVEDRLSDYDKDSDIEFFRTARDAEAVVADAENWVILFPLDAHMPCMDKDGRKSDIRKIVVKIPFAAEAD